MAQINKDMTVLDILNVDPDIAGILMKEGMHCIFCGAASGESLQMAGYVHGLGDEAMNDLVDRINDFLANKPEEGQEAEAAAE